MKKNNQIIDQNTRNMLLKSFKFWFQTIKLRNNKYKSIALTLYQKILILTFG